MAAAPLPPLIHSLKNIQRWIWLLIFGGALVFIGMVLALAAINPATPANQLLAWENGWVFLPPAGMVAYGLYVSVRYWRCPQCRLSLPTKYPVPPRCRRCGNPLRVSA